MHELAQRPEYLSDLRSFRDVRELVKIITGVRRCGKTTILLQFIEELRLDGVSDEEILMIDLESPEFSSIIDHSQLNSYLRDTIPRTGRFYLFLDELQRVKDWEKTASALLVDTEADIYIISSDADLLSGHYTTYMAGRYVEFRMLPLSFREYFGFRGNGRHARDVLEEYFCYGGFPNVDPENGERAASVTLEDVYSSIVLKDMISCGKVRKPEELERMIRYLMRNNGDPIENSVLSKALDMNPRTVERYLEIIQSAYLIYRSDRLDPKTDTRSPTPTYYAVDPGLLNSSTSESDCRLRVIRDVVFLELKRRGYRVFSGRSDTEDVHFITDMKGRKAYWQVCLGYYDDRTEERELAPLRAIRDNNPKTVILMDVRGVTFTGDGIREMGMTDFLLEEI